MIVSALSTTAADTHLAARQQGHPHSPQSHELGFGKREPAKSSIPLVLERLDELRSKHEKTRSFAEFDAEASVAIHETLKIDDRTAAEDDFWRYLAVVELYDLVVWRHSSQAEQTESPHPSNFGIGDRWECLPKRLWFRAELSADPALEDPYLYSRRGGADFWASGLLRKLYSCSRPVARALTRFQYPEGGAFEGNQYRPQTLTLGGVRELYKRLRHFHATLALAALTDEQADDMVASLVEDLPRQS